MGQESLDPDPADPVEGDRPLPEADRCRPFVWQHSGVGEAAVVVDTDVHVLIADLAPAPAFQVGAAWVVPESPLASEGPFAGIALDPAEPRMTPTWKSFPGRERSLEAATRAPKRPSLPSPRAGQDAGGRRERNPGEFGDLG